VSPGGRYHITPQFLCTFNRQPYFSLILGSSASEGSCVLLVICLEKNYKWSVNLRSWKISISWLIAFTTGTMKFWGHMSCQIIKGNSIRKGWRDFWVWLYWDWLATQFLTNKEQYFLFWLEAMQPWRQCKDGTAHVPPR